MFGHGKYFLWMLLPTPLKAVHLLPLFSSFYRLLDHKFHILFRKGGGAIERGCKAKWPVIHSLAYGRNGWISHFSGTQGRRAK